MAKFCKYCGKSLADGEVCNCTSQGIESQASSEEMRTSNTKVEILKEHTSNFFKDIINVFKDPLKYGNEIIGDKKSVGKSFAFYGLTAFTYFLIVLSITKKAELLMGSINFRIILIMLLSVAAITIVFDSLFALANMLISMIFKSKIDYKTSFGIVELSNIPKAAINLLIFLFILALQ